MGLIGLHPGGNQLDSVTEGIGRNHLDRFGEERPSQNDIGFELVEVGLQLRQNRPPLAAETMKLAKKQKTQPLTRLRSHVKMWLS